MVSYAAVRYSVSTTSPLFMDAAVALAKEHFNRNLTTANRMTPPFYPTVDAKEI
ncbi:MAG: hypothetical protein QGG15_04055 [Dehalococcoidales bacterium]|nr:hypothetical protein [Dehalococcoidales bacterium]MDP6738179.1 hypothetical protein [Dehalococcoidales bacterium]